MLKIFVPYSRVSIYIEDHLDVKSMMEKLNNGKYR